MKDKIIKKRQTLLLLVIFGFVVLFSIPNVLAGENSSELNEAQTFLHVTPKRCVALRKGQLCYLEVIFQWQTQEKGNYCLFNEHETEALFCWDKVDNGQFYLDFQSRENTGFMLRKKGDSRAIAHAQVIVAWVYGNKKRHRAHWRLF